MINIVNHVHSCDVRHTTTVHRHIHTRVDAQKAYETFPASIRGHYSPYAAKDVIEVSADSHFEAPDLRFAHPSLEDGVTMLCYALNNKYSVIFVLQVQVNILQFRVPFEH